MLHICGLSAINIKINDIETLRRIINLVIKSFPTTKVQLEQQYLICSSHWLLILNFLPRQVISMQRNICSVRKLSYCLASVHTLQSDISRLCHEALSTRIYLNSNPVAC